MHTIRAALLGILMLLLSGSSLIWAESSPIEVVLSTPISSRINQAGHDIKGVLAGPVTLRNEQILPTGTILHGKVAEVESSTDVHRPGRIKLVFKQAILPSREIKPVYFIPDTPDGWLNKADTYLSACKVVPGHSTRLLNIMVRRKLPTDRAVWSQVLGINNSGIPDITTDQFIEEYNRHDVLLGAGDWIRLRSVP